MAQPGYTDPLFMHIMARQGQRPMSPNAGHMGQGRSMPLSLPRDTSMQSAKQKAFQPSNQPEQKKGWWGGFKDRMNLDNQTLLMGGLGLLAGDRYSGPQMMMQNLAYGMDANKADKQDALQQAKMDQFKKGLTPEQAMLFDVAPGAVAGGMAEQMFAKPTAQKPLVVNGRVLDPSNPQNVLADYSDPDGPDWQRTTINKDGVPTIVEYDRNAKDPQATMRPIGSEYVKPDPDAGRPDASAEGQFRREFNSLTKDFRAVHESYNRITATDTSTPAGQMGLIFQYMKMLDPGSTVREGEYATAQNTTGVPGQVLNAYNKAIEGEFLNKNQILDFESQAKNLYDRAAQIYGDRVKDYRRLADEYEFSPDRTVVDVRGFFEPAQGVGGPDAPPPGVDPQDWEYMTPEERPLWGNG